MIEEILKNIVIITYNILKKLLLSGPLYFIFITSIIIISILLVIICFIIYCDKINFSSGLSD